MRDYRYALAPTSQLFFCGVPFRLDVKPKCGLNCLYCYAATRGGRKTNANQILNIDWFRRKLETSLSNNYEGPNIISELLSNRFAIHLGGMSDPFADNLTEQTTRSLLSLLSSYKYPVIISTKMPGKLLSCDLDKLSSIIQVSICITDIQIQSILEPYSENTISRLNNIKHLVDLGYNVVCRIQPIFPQLIDTIPLLVDLLAEAGCSHIILEYLKLPNEKEAMDLSVLQSTTGWDLPKFYNDNNANIIGREHILPTRYRYNHLMPIKEYANLKGISVSLADYGLYHLSDINCCCGVDKFNLDCQWNKGNFSYIIRNINDDLYFSYLLNFWHPEGTISRYVNSHSRLDENSFITHLRNKWNRPGTANVPDSFLGVQYLGRKDENGDCIYRNNSSNFRR